MEFRSYAHKIVIEHYPEVINFMCDLFGVKESEPKPQVILGTLSAINYPPPSEGTVFRTFLSPLDEDPYGKHHNPSGRYLAKYSLILVNPYAIVGHSKEAKSKHIRIKPELEIVRVLGKECAQHYFHILNPEFPQAAYDFASTFAWGVKNREIHVRDVVEFYHNLLFSFSWMEGIGYAAKFKLANHLRHEDAYRAFRKSFVDDRKRVLRHFAEREGLGISSIVFYGDRTLLERIIQDLILFHIEHYLYNLQKEEFQREVRKPLNELTGEQTESFKQLKELLLKVVSD